MNVELRRVAFSIPVVGLMAAAAACDEETPTSIGGSLLPGPPVETFEVVLDPSDYLVSDTSFSGYVGVAQAVVAYDYLIIANDFEGALNARALAEFGNIPDSITVVDTAGTQRTDTLPEYIGGELLILVDTTQTTPAPVTVQAFRATQSWNAASANWTTRTDTGDVELPWSEPGGSPGVLAGTGTWTVSDTLRIPIDAETIEAWRDTTNVAGVVLVSAPGTRLRTARNASGEIGLELRVDAQSSIADTVVTSTVPSANRIFIFDPPVPRDAAGIRVAGAPSWRAFVQFRESFDTLTVPCPPDFGAPGCRLPLSDASISYAALLLEPMPPPPGFTPEGELQLGASLLLVDPLIPIERSPIGSAVGLMPEALPASRFVDPADGPVELMITSFVSALTRDSADITTRPSPNIALFEASGLVGTGGQIGAFQSTEGLTFGFATFASRPRLRLLLTVPGDLGLR